MIVTDDAKVLKVEGHQRHGYLIVGAKISPDMKKYLETKGEAGYKPAVSFSLRSKLARCGADARLSGWEIHEDLLMGKLEYINRGLPIEYRPGDEIGRFFGYHQKEALRGQELYDMVRKWTPQESVRMNPEEWNEFRDSTIALELQPYKVYEVRKSKEPVRAPYIIDSNELYLKIKEVTPEEVVEELPFESKERMLSQMMEDKSLKDTLFWEWLAIQLSKNGFCVVESVAEIEIPEGHYGLIPRRTSLWGSTNQASSVIVDPAPKFQGKLLYEIVSGTPGEHLSPKRYGYLRIYPDTLSHTEERYRPEKPEKMETRRERKERMTTISTGVAACPWRGRCEEESVEEILGMI